MINQSQQLTSSVQTAQPTHTPNIESKTLWQTVSIPTAEKPLILKIDSPRTLESCQELGLIMEDFKPRPLESFGGTNVNEKVRKLRYDHFHGRMAQAAKEVLRRRREIIRRNHAQHQEEMLNNSKSSPRIGALNESKNNIMSQSSGNLGILMKPPIMFTKTVEYFRKNHTGAEINVYKDIATKSLETDHEPFPMTNFDNLLRREVEKYNKTKEQTQKEAKFMLDQEKVKLKILEDLKEKEMRIRKQALKLSFEKELRERKLEAVAKEKSDQLKEHEKKYQEQKLRDRKKLKEKFQVNALKQQKDSEAKEINKLKKIEQHIEKMKKIEDLKKRLEKEEIEKGMKIKTDIEQKLLEVNSKHEKSIFDYKEKCVKREDKIAENIENHRELDENAEKIRLEKYFEKMKKHEERAEILWRKNVENEFEQKQKKLEKILASTRNKNQTLKLQRSKIKENENRSKEMLKTSQRRKETEKESLLLKHEMRRLKEKDKLNNYERKRRTEQFKLQKLLEKEKKKQEIQMTLQLERDVQQKARIERVIHSKLERDRIMEKIGEVASILDLKKSNDLHDLDPVEKKKGKTILKSILPDKDCDCLYFDEPKKEDKENGDANSQLAMTMTMTAKSNKTGGGASQHNSQQFTQINTLKQSKTIKV